MPIIEVSKIKVKGCALEIVYAENKMEVVTSMFNAVAYSYIL